VERLWAPWRLEYVQNADKQDGCVFCRAAASADDEAQLVVNRGERAFVLLNKFPYASGHLLVAPYRHGLNFGDLDDAEILEIHRLGAQGLEALAATYAPDLRLVGVAAVDLGLPLSFHILTGPSGKVRGPKINGFLTIVRSCQDVMGALVFGAVFERHPNLKVVCAEADAGWAPHYAYRMDHAYDRHRNWMPHGDLSKKPSEYFNENVYVTFQDDWVAFKVTHLMNVERLMWANDFPHSDSTWPWSQEMLTEHTAHLSEPDKQCILHDNVADLYRLPTAATSIAATSTGSTNV